MVRTILVCAGRLLRLEIQCMMPRTMAAWIKNMPINIKVARKIGDIGILLLNYNQIMQVVTGMRIHGCEFNTDG
ncbi:hypothetical protein [Paenibacillus terrae]|uniref:hypothetical protein n=1 Tax=Paenibacillus terrae TaxID=159743 RepID=UPI00165687E5|nr:hypothetical protein [Paenibacillus terrae]